MTRTGNTASFRLLAHDGRLRWRPGTIRACAVREYGLPQNRKRLPDEKVLFLSDIFPTGYMAAENAQIYESDTVAVWGCGPVGSSPTLTKWGSIVFAARAELRHTSGLQQVQGGTAFAFNLSHRAGFRCFVGPPPKQLRTMTKAASGEMVELHFDNESRFQRLPFG